MMTHGFGMHVWVTNFKMLEEMTRKGMVTGMPLLSHPSQVCEGCMIAKQARQSFPKEAQWRAKEPLQLLHADLCGPITPATKGGNQYFLLIVDDYSRYMWVYLIKNKYEAFGMFQKFKIQVEKESRYKIKMLRTDRGGEFNSNQLQEFCKQSGIRRQLTAPYSPQQNGVAERRNRTILEMTRSLLKAMTVPDQFWGEAVRHSVYLLNRIGTKALKDATPYEAWKGSKPSIAHLKVFGCVGFVKKLRGLTKLSDRSETMVYLGVEEGTKGYRLYNPRNRRLVIARDVIFDEAKRWAWNEELTGEPLTTPYWTNIVVNVTAQSQPAQEQGQTNDVNKNPSSLINNIVSSSDNFVTGNSLSDDSQWPNSPGIGSRLTSPSQFSSNSEQSETVASFDDTPVQGFRSINEMYEDTTRMNDAEVQELYERNQELLLIDDEPTSFEEASTERNWKQAMETELRSIEKNNTWTLTKLPPNRKAIGLKWVFKLKRDAAGNVIKHKARLVAKGYVQERGIDFEEAFAPVARLETIRLILAMATKENWLVHHLDVKSAFLHGDLKEEVYVSQPVGFLVKGKENMVYRLHKALYGLRQAPRAWNIQLDRSLKRLGFTRCAHEQAVYKVHKPNLILIVGVYVDDLIVTGSSEKGILEFKEKMKTLFDMSDLGLLSYYLGIEVSQGKDGIMLTQKGYAEKILKVTAMEDCNSTQYPMEAKLQLTKDEDGEPVNATNYRRLVGSLRYLVHTRPDLNYSVGTVSKYMQNPKQSHYAAVKHILRYVKGTLEYGLMYHRGGDGMLVGYSDSSYGNDRDDRRGTTGVAYYYSGNLITWASQKQQTVALSSCEAEYMAATAAACQGLWLRNLFSELVGRKAQKVKLLVDNKSAIALIKNPVFHGRSKHIDTKYHFIRMCVERDQIHVEHVSGDQQRADILTKALPRIKFAEMRGLIGVEDLKKKVNIDGEKC